MEKTLLTTCVPSPPAFGSGSGATKPESAKTDACPNGRGLKMISLKGLPEKVLPPKKVVFKDLLPQSPDVNTGAGVGRSPAARVYEQTSFARCAVVGNGGILKTAKYGRAIDSHTVVFRANQAPVKTYEQYVGTKATFRILNKKWTQQYSRGDKMWLPLERGATLVASRGDPAIAKRLIVAYPKRPDVSIVGLDTSVRGAVGKLMNDFRVILKTCANVKPPGREGANPSTFTCSQHTQSHLI